MSKPYGIQYVQTQPIHQFNRTVRGNNNLKISSYAIYHSAYITALTYETTFGLRYFQGEERDTPVRTASVLPTLRLPLFGGMRDFMD